MAAETGGDEPMKAIVMTPEAAHWMRTRDACKAAIAFAEQVKPTSAVLKSIELRVHDVRCIIQTADAVPAVGQLLGSKTGSDVMESIRLLAQVRRVTFIRCFNPITYARLLLVCRPELLQCRVQTASWPRC